MKKKVMFVLMSVLALATMIVPAFAAEAATSVTFADFSGVMTALTGQISTTTVLSVLAGVAGACVGLAFMWWGIRKAVGALMSAFKKGRVSI